MRSIVDKFETLRKAKAQSFIRLAPSTLGRVSSNDLPKKDVLAISKAAGISAAKKTWDLIPYCHPIPIDFINVEFKVNRDGIEIEATVKAVSKTGLEMEALTAVSVAALNIYDMLKPIDKTMEIQSIRLIEKEGGKSSFVEHIPQGFSAGVIVTSDGTFEGKREDKSGKIIVDKLKEWDIPSEYVILPDEKEKITACLKKLCEKRIPLIITTGGTGLGPRDVTVEATQEVIEREIPGIMEAARTYGQKRTPYAMLSRGLAGQIGKTIILNLPGSSKGTEETLNAVFPAVLHSYKMMRGEGHKTNE